MLYLLCRQKRCSLMRRQQRQALSRPACLPGHANCLSSIIEYIYICLWYDTMLCGGCAKSLLQAHVNDRHRWWMMNNFVRILLSILWQAQASLCLAEMFLAWLAGAQSASLFFSSQEKRSIQALTWRFSLGSPTMISLLNGPYSNIFLKKTVIKMFFDSLSTGHKSSLWPCITKSRCGFSASSSQWKYTFNPLASVPSIPKTYSSRVCWLMGSTAK